MLKKHIGFGLNLLSIGLFVPGIIFTMFRLDMEMAATFTNARLASPLIGKELSIVDTVVDLWQDDRIVVSLLILIFSICIPLSKAFMLLVAYIKRNTMLEKRLLNFVSSIGKWSMADVFVVAVFLAVLSTNHADTANSHQISVFGLVIPIEISTQTLSAVGSGFYFFTAYCLVSLLGSQLMLSSVKEPK